MNILIIGGDRRTLEIIKSLQIKHKVDVLGFKALGLDTIKLDKLNFNNYDAIIFPVSGINEDLTINATFNTTNLDISNIEFNIKENCKIFSGIQTKKLDELCSENYIKLMNFNDVSVENSIPTAEGVIADIIQNTDETLNNLNITILGYGRVGKTLVDYLMKLEANINVGVIEETDYITLIYRHIKVFYSTNLIYNIRNSDVIINTVPHPILNNQNLNFVKKYAYIIDIASAPYGIDYNYAKEKNIKYSILKGIPGKTASKTSGNILAKKISMILEED